MQTGGTIRCTHLVNVGGGHDPNGDVDGRMPARWGQEGGASSSHATSLLMHAPTPPLPRLGAPLGLGGHCTVVAHTTRRGGGGTRSPTVWRQKSNHSTTSLQAVQACEHEQRFHHTQGYNTHGGLGAGGAEVLQKKLEVCPLAYAPNRLYNQLHGNTSATAANRTKPRVHRQPISWSRGCALCTLHQVNPPFVPRVVDLSRAARASQADEAVLPAVPASSAWPQPLARAARSARAAA
jgi:hypothetical protein